MNMDNKVLEGLFNKNLYNSLILKLNNLENDKKSPASIREELSNDINKANLKMSDVTATVAAYYKYSLDKKELSFLTVYYHKTFSYYFNIDIIKKYYNHIVKDELLFNIICNLCDKEILSTLRNYSKTLSKPKVVSKEKFGNKVVTLKNNLLKKFILNVNTVNMVNPIFISKANASICDKVGTAFKKDINLMIENVKKINDKFSSISTLDDSKIKYNINSMSNKLIKVSLNNIIDKKIIAISGTKVTTFNDKIVAKIV